MRPIHGVALLFLVNGMTFPTLWPRLPEIRDAVGATSASFGLALVGGGLGGLLGSLAAPLVARWLGMRAAALMSALLLAMATVLVGLAPSVIALFVAFAGVGMADGVADVTQNALLFDVQRMGARSVASRMHAVWSAGALAATAAATAAAALGIAVVVQLVAVAGLAIVFVLLARLPLGAVRTAERIDLAAASPATPPQRAEPAPPRPVGPGAATWILLLVTGTVVAAIEGVANEWSALTLRDGLGATVTTAGLGPTVFTGALLVGRLVGDRAIDRYGAARVALTGAAAVAFGGGAGLALAAALDLPALLLVGLAIAGVGTAPLFPLMLQAGDRIDVSGRGVAMASAGARAGFLVVPLAMGGVGEAFGLTTAFVLLPVVGVASALALPRALRR